jgi:clan AA aspartic protease
VIGIVDEKGRALLEVLISDRSDGAYTPVTTWIDTAFDGHLVFPHELIEKLNLESLVETEAILADGSKVTLETFVCFVDWFGNRLALQVIANEGRFPLLGTGLLEQRVLHIDYAKMELSLN